MQNVSLKKEHTLIFVVKRVPWVISIRWEHKKTKIFLNVIKAFQFFISQFEVKNVNIFTDTLWIGTFGDYGNFQLNQVAEQNLKIKLLLLFFLLKLTWPGVFPYFLANSRTNGCPKTPVSG